MREASATLEGDTLTVSTGSNYKSDAFVLFVAEYGADGRLLAVHSEKITAESGTYTFKVQPGATIKCFLLHADTYAPLFAPSPPRHKHYRKVRRMELPSAGLYFLTAPALCEKPEHSF